MEAESNHFDSTLGRREAIEAIRREYGQVTFYDSTTVIAGGKKHKIPEGTTYISGQTGARPKGHAISGEQSSLSSNSQRPSPAIEEGVRRRREAIEAIRREYGEVTFYDSTTVIAGGKKHQVPEGTVFESAPAEWKVGPRGGIYKEWYSPRSGRSYRDYQK
jgi:hypothetical protein